MTLAEYIYLHLLQTNDTENPKELAEKAMQLAAVFEDTQQASDYPYV